MKNSDDSGYTGKHVGVCVLDTGIFPHIDFTGRILAFQDFIGHRIRPYDDNSHGTHVCGIIGGDGRASEGRIRGIAPEDFFDKHLTEWDRELVDQSSDSQRAVCDHFFISEENLTYIKSHAGFFIGA